MVLSNNTTAQSAAGTPTSDHSLSVGAAASSAAADQSAQVNWEATGLATSDCYWAIGYGSVYGNLTVPATPSGFQVSSLDADGVTYQQLVGDTTNRVFWYIGMGDSPGGPPGPNALMMMGIGL
jgi:hypothetical protein